MYRYITYFEIAAFLSSLFAWPAIRKSPYLRWYPALLFVILSVETYETFFIVGKHGINSTVYDVQVPLQYLLYLVILYFATLRRSYKKGILISILAYIPASVLSEMYLTPAHHFNEVSYSLGSALLITFILAKLYEMLQMPAGFDFLKDPFFYMLFSYLLFNVGTLPYFSMGNWLYFVKGYHSAVNTLANVMSMLNYVLYTTYTIAFIWMAVKKPYRS